jgi:hypothetical protein
MKKMIATVRERESKEILNITSEYNTLKEFRTDLNRNGYEVIGRIEVEGENNKRKELYDRGCKAR